MILSPAYSFLLYNLLYKPIVSCRNLFGSAGVNESLFALTSTSSTISFFPYGALDCIFLHSYVSEHYEGAKVYSPYTNQSRLRISKILYDSLSLFKHCSTSVPRLHINNSDIFAELSSIFDNHFKLYFPKCYHIATSGFLDYYIATFPTSFFQGFKFDATELKTVVILPILEIVSSYYSSDCFVIGESAYAEMSLIRAYAFEFNIPIYVLNPDGSCRKLSYPELVSETFVGHCNLSLRSEREQQRLIHLSKKYTENRFSGKSQDPDSRASFKSAKFSQLAEHSRKKVLFLHSIRDANNINTSKSPLFRSYYEWTAYCLNVIANNEDEWFIKIHPMSRNYSGDLSIIHGLLDAYNINPNVYQKCPPTEYILKNNMPIYTFNGTVSLESLCYTQYAIAVGDRVDPAYVIKPASREHYSILLNLSYEDLLAALKCPSNIKVVESSISLMDLKSRCDVSNLFPSRRIERSDSHFHKLILLLTSGSKKTPYTY